MSQTWFARALRYLRREWVAQHAEALTPEAVPPDHEGHLVIDRLSGALIMCCSTHDNLFEQQLRSHATLAPIREPLGRTMERHITERLGGNARDYPGPPR